MGVCKDTWTNQCNTNESHKEKRVLGSVNDQKVSTQVCKCAICVSMTYYRSYSFLELTLTLLFPLYTTYVNTSLGQMTVKFWPRCHDCFTEREVLLFCGFG